MAGEEVAWPGLSESEDSDSEEEGLCSSPPAIYGFRPGPGFLVAEEVQGEAAKEDEVAWPGHSESEDSDSEKEALCSSPPAIYGFRPGPGFLVAEELQGGAAKENEVKGDVGEMQILGKEQVGRHDPDRMEGGGKEGSVKK